MHRYHDDIYLFVGKISYDDQTRPFFFIFFFFNDRAPPDFSPFPPPAPLPFWGARRVDRRATAGLVREVDGGRRLAGRVGGRGPQQRPLLKRDVVTRACGRPRRTDCVEQRSEEHTSELQSPCNLVCRLLLEKKK